jgi:fatty-acyl-CoA synthase
MPFIKAGDIRLYYEDGGRGRALLMIQGLGYDHRPWLWLRRELEKSMRVIVYDNRGAGKSDKPPGPYSVEMMADDAAALLGALGIEKASVFGVSLGGSIAQMFALRHPDRLEKLVLGCSFFTGDPGRMDMPAATVEILTKREGTPEEIARRGLGAAFSEAYPASRPDVYEQLVRWRVDEPIPAAGYFAQLGAGMSFDVEKDVGKITGDVLVMHGELDRVVPAGRGRELAAAIPGARLHMFERCGHLFFVEEAEATAALIADFVEGRGPGTLVPRPAAGKNLPWHANDFLARRAALSPGRVAVTDERGRQARTYAELNARAERVAAFLADGLGVKKGQRVGALGLNAPCMVELLFACAKIGAVFVPFNYRLAGDELRAIVEDAALSVFCFDGAHRGALKTLGKILPHRSRMIALDGKAAREKGVAAYEHISSLTAADAVQRRGPVVTLEDAWIICYTGGTTGRPKGAVLTHGSVFWNAVNTIAGWGLRENDVAPIFTPLFHTGGLNVLLLPLLAMGGTGVLAAAFDPEKAFRIIRRCRATYVFMVPSMFRMMMESPRWDKEKFRSVRAFVTGGAPCPRNIFEAFAAKRKSFRMGYGLTEAGPNNFHIDPAVALEHFGSVGTPLPFVQARIETDDGREAGPDEHGELLLGGGHVFGGYWNRPDETAAVFSGRWLRTGDLARRDAEGRYFIVGRRKEMFISGGENVFPVEVEEVILRHPAVYEAAVVGILDEKWGEVGRAVVSLKKGARLSPEDLRTFLRERLAHYKVPKQIEIVDELPKTPAGKIRKGSDPE